MTAETAELILNSPFADEAHKKHLEYHKQNGSESILYGEIKYADWYHMMPVVIKIEKAGYHVNILGNTCSIYDEPFRRVGEGYRKSTVGTDKQTAVLNAIVEFIKWYNETKQI